MALDRTLKQDTSSMGNVGDVSIRTQWIDIWVRSGGRFSASQCLFKPQNIFFSLPFWGFLFDMRQAINPEPRSASASLRFEVPSWHENLLLAESLGCGAGPEGIMQLGEYKDDLRSRRQDKSY